MNEKLAETLWTTGAGYAAAARILTEEARRDATVRGEDADELAFNGMLSASTHLLVGFGFELLLKAAFLCLGGDYDLLVKKVRHDLVLALDGAQSVGFSIRPGLRGILEGLREPHLAHHFRYGGPDSIMMPALDQTLPALDTLTRDVGALIHGWSSDPPAQSREG